MPQDQHRKKDQDQATEAHHSPARKNISGETLAKHGALNPVATNTATWRLGLSKRLEPALDLGYGPGYGHGLRVLVSDINLL
ncbi:hypothetical protein ACOMHN_062618 [Nucella lapillus]